MSRSPPVILFTGALAGDGVSRNTVHLANALARRGIPVEVLCLSGGALMRGFDGPAVTRLGRLPGPRAIALAAAVPTLHRRLRDCRPSVVMSMGNHAHLALWAALRGLPDVPRIYRISNDTRHGAGPLREAGLRLIANDATSLVFVSAALAERSAFRKVRRDRRGLVLANGVDAATVQARAADALWHPWIADGASYVAAVGRLHAQKNYARLIKALALARVDRPDLRLLIIGVAPRRRRARLEAIAEAHGVGSAIRFEGEVANPFPLVAGAQAYVLPSLWEGASNSLLEALACKVPVVAARSAGNASAVLDGGRFGVLVDGLDPEDIARGLIRQTGADPILPANRAAAFDLDAVTGRLCAAVMSARSVHDEIQILPEARSHLRSLSTSVRAANPE